MKPYHPAALLGLIALLVACPQTPAPDTTAPSVLSSAPTSGATGVVASASLSIHFSESMDKAALQLSATPTTVFGAAVWSDSSTVVYNPSSGWQLGTTYTLAVTGKDLAGNAFLTTTISFQTVTAADTTAPATPSGIKVTPGDAKFTLEWNANTEADLSGYTVYWGDTANALVNASFVAKPATGATVSDLENAKAHFYAVDAEDSSGNHSAKSAVLSVTPSDTTPPALTSSEPSNGALVFAAPSLSFSFSEPMNPASLEIGLCVTTDPPASATCDLPVLASFGVPTWSDGDTRVQFTPPAGSFPSGKTYVLLVFGKDKAGNALTSDARVAFATRAAPDTTTPTVSDGSILIDNAKATITLAYTFSEAMNQTSVQNAFLSQPPLTCAWTWTGNGAICTIVSGVKQDTDYTFTIGTGAADTAGNTLASAHQRSLKTGNFWPRVTKFTPNPGAFGGFFAANTPITVTFSEPISTVVFSVKVGGQAVSGHISLSDSPAGKNTVVTYTPNTGYGDGKTVTWTLFKTTSDATGLGLVADVTNSFQTKPVIAP